MATYYSTGEPLIIFGELHNVFLELRDVFLELRDVLGSCVTLPLQES